MSKFFAQLSNIFHGNADGQRRTDYQRPTDGQRRTDYQRPTDGQRKSDGFVSGSHADFIEDKQGYFGALPRVVQVASNNAKAVSGLEPQGLSQAVQSVTPYGSDYQSESVPYFDRLFMPIPSDTLNQLYTTCTSSTLEQLKRTQDPSAPTRCGWIYQKANSTNGVMSQGYPGTNDGPLDVYPDSTAPAGQWYFNLDDAQRDIRIDECATLTNCSDVDQSQYSGLCGYNKDKNYGIPIENGKPKYPKTARATGGAVTDSTSSTGIATNKGQCYVPPQSATSNALTIPTDQTCIDGNLSADCIYQKIASRSAAIPCSSNGTLAIALNDAYRSRNPDYLASIRNDPSMQLYQRLRTDPSNPATFDLVTFSSGNTTLNQALAEAKKIATAANNNTANSALGALARDLCMDKGSIDAYAFCCDLSDHTTITSVSLKCLQKIFMKAGGDPSGRSYPTINNMQSKYYAQYGVLGDLRKYLNKLVARAKGQKIKEGFENAAIIADATAQTQALSALTNLRLNTPSQRPPPDQGVEVLWFVPQAGHPTNLLGFLKRTIECQFIQYNPGGSHVPSLGIYNYGAMVQVTDVRVPNDCTANFSFCVDDGFWISVSNPPTIDSTIINRTIAARNSGKSITIDEPGILANLGLQGPTWYGSNSCHPFRAATPNIMKVYHDDAGGGWHSLLLQINGCGSKPMQFDNRFLTLTCERVAPFLTYEVGAEADGSMAFQELRNPGLFGQFLSVVGTTINQRTDSMQFVPGSKNFMQMKNASSGIILRNIAYQGWQTFTMAVRMTAIGGTSSGPQDLSKNNTLVRFAMGGGYLSVIAVPISSNTYGITIEHNLQQGKQLTVSTPYQLTMGSAGSVNNWYLIVVTSTVTSFSVNCMSIADIVNKATPPNATVLDGSQRLFSKNATEAGAQAQQAQETCNIRIGTAGFTDVNGKTDNLGIYSTTICAYDVAWAHFFDYAIKSDMLIRECACDWIYTTYPNSFDNYKS